jgi:hypothetical protein
MTSTLGTVSLLYSEKLLGNIDGKLAIESDEGFILVWEALDHIIITVEIEFNIESNHALMLNANISAKNSSNAWQECQKFLDRIAVRDFYGFCIPIQGWRYFPRSPNDNQPVSDWLSGVTTAQDYANKAYELRDAIARKNKNSL